MIQHYRYRGHAIRLELIEVLPRRFRWKTTIDDRHHAHGGGALLAEDVARSEAFVYAQVAVARIRRLVSAAMH